MNIRYAGLSDTGLARSKNEDNWYVDYHRGLFIVADGMGGHRAGEVASALVVEQLPRLLQDYPLPPGHELSESSIDHMRTAMTDLNAYIYWQGKTQTGRYGMGAAAVVALIHDHQAIVGHMGDSRLYLMRDNELSRVTSDHSMTAYLVALGKISEDEASTHERSGDINQYFGMKEDPLPDVQLIHLEKNDRLLLCSDGLNSMLDGDQISELTKNGDSPWETCVALVDASNSAGGKDNITAIVIDVVG